MAELRKRGATGSSREADSESTRDSFSVTAYPKERNSASWTFFFILILYLFSLYVSFKASRSVPSPKTTMGSSSSEFVEEKARQHLDAITSFGPRPAGSYANEIQAVNYIVGALQAIKDTAREDVIIEIDIQRPSGSFNLAFFDGFSSVYRNVTNIVVRITPKESYPPKNTVLVNGHFDSVPGSPGASDDVVSCAVMLEVIRCLTHTHSFRFIHGVVFNFNGAEENVLQASHGFITQHRWAETIKAFVNLEAAGAGGREVLFQAGPEHPWLIKTYSEVAPHPCAQALAQDIFQSGIIPSDTDFRIYRDFGQVPGMDLAYTANGYVYHTYYDTPAAVTPGSIQRAGDNVLALVKSIVNSPFLADPGEYRHGSMVFFDFLGIFVVHYPERIGLVINLSSAFVAVLCLLKKFLQFPAKRTKFEEGKVSRPPSSIADLLISLFILMLSWIVGTSFSVAVGVVLTHSGHALTWYCRPYLLLALYIAPSVLGIGFVHFLVKKYIMAKEKAVVAKKEDIRPLEERITDKLMKKEAQTFYAAFLVWTVIILIMSYYRLASAYFPLLFIIFPLMIRVVIWDIVLAAKTCHQNVGAVLFMYLVATVVPVQFCMYVTFVMLDLFVPIMGRGGTQTPPDVFIGVLCAFGVVMLTSYVVSTVYILGNLKFPAIFLLFVTTVGMIVSFSGLSFPYSAVNQCPKRVFFQHTSRTFYNNAGEVVHQDAGVWITPLDYLGIQPFSDAPMFKKALPAPQEGAYGGFPYYLPLRHFVRKSWYLPGPLPQVKTSPLEVKLLHRKEKDQVYSFKFSISGPDHMTLYISPASGVDLLTSSLGPLIPIQDGGDRVVFFIYYSHGTDVGPWELSLELLPERHLPNKSNLFDFAVAAHYIHGKESSSPFLKEVIQAIPDWIFANDWVDTYKSWSYTT